MPRRPRRPGRATSDAERRALAKAHGRSTRPPPPSRPGFTVLWTDGGARERLAAIGYLLEETDGSTLAAHGEPIGPASATVAEYMALRAGLTRARELGLAQVDARSDSRLLVAHLIGDHRPTNPRLAALGDEILELAAIIGSVVFTWVPSEANSAAHSLVARALMG